MRLQNFLTSCRWLRAVIQFFCWATFGTFATAQPIGLTVNVNEFERQDSVELDGEWWFWFGEHRQPNEIPTFIKAGDFSTIAVPSHWNDHPDVQSAPKGHGIGTYAVPIQLTNTQNQSLGLYIPHITDHFQIYWFDEINGTTLLIAQSDGWGNRKTFTLERQLFALPAGLTSGLLVIHVEKNVFFRGGIRKPISVVDLDAKQHSENLSMLIKAFFIGSIFVMSLHYFVQFLYFRDNNSSFYLAIVCLVVTLRISSTSGIVDHLLLDISQNHSLIRLRIEYLTIVLGPIFFLAYFNALIKPLFPQWLVKLIALETAVFGTMSFVINSTTLTEWLPWYQLHAGSISIIISSFLLYGAYKNLPYARLVLAGSLVILLAVMHDIYAARTTTYNVYLMDLAMFAFIFFQALVVGRSLNESRLQSARLMHEKLSLEAAHRIVVEESQRDHLTGLYNRKAFDERFSVEWQKAQAMDQRIGLILFDLDHFKSVNDQYGHIVGDEVLKFVAAILNAHNFRPRDFVSRYGGEEFVIVLPDSDLAGTERVAELIRKKIKASEFCLDDISFFVTSSFGVSSCVPSSAVTQEDILERADQALYLAKEKGRDQVFVAN